MRLYHNRLVTFNTESWLFLGKTQTPEQLAYVGFFYVGYKDKTQSYHCGISLSMWEPDDKPGEMHAFWSPHCDFYRNLIAVRNVNSHSS